MLAADYVIVGAGSAGCVMAARLSENRDVRVVLLEAGGKDRSPNIKIPAGFPEQFHTKLDWDYYTEPEPHVNGRRLYVPRGKSLGGSSSMNAMLYVRGRPVDYDLWKESGADGWGWDDVRPYFLKAEDDQRGGSEHHGMGGPCRIEEERDPRPVTASLIAAANAVGIPNAEDYNSPEQDGVSMAQTFQKNGRRWSTADAYLRPAMKRDNLEVVTGAQVERIEMDGTRVTGVTFTRRGRSETVRAYREVIVCAGAINSPQVLMTSGIGPAAHLREHGIEVRHDLPGVGQNLQDHPFLTMNYEINESDTLYGAEHPKYLAQWLLRRKGPLTSTAAEAMAFVRTRSGLPAADIQLHMGPLYFENHGADTYEGDVAVCGPTLISPKSRGAVTLRSADPFDKPRILTNSLSEPEDVASMVAGMRLTQKLMDAEPMRSKVVKRLLPEPGVMESGDDADLEDALRERMELIYHPVGTCRMGTDDDAVLDPELRVRGLVGLRVVDASVMPVIPGGNTNAPTIMVAEKAADFIKGRVAVPA